MAESAHEPLEATLRRLKQERDVADRLYNEALTALDQAFRPSVDVPQPPYPIDEHQLTPLNEAWNTLPSRPAIGSGLRGRLTAFVWRMVGPSLERQLTFNSLLVDHINRNVKAQRDAHAASEAIAAALREHVASQAQFHSRLLVFLQQVIGYIDTNDRDTAGGALVVNAALSGVAENVSKRWESVTSRQQRLESRAAAVEAEHEELRATIGVVQQANLTLKREIERARVSVPGVPQVPEVQVPEVQVPEVRGAQAAFAPALDAYKYVGFENQFRGSEAAIRERQESYLPFFAGLSDVLDVGCGRGEFVELLNARGIGARGIDLNHEMVELCRARGLDVTEADAVGYLSALDDGSLGGVFAAQVVEHLEPAYLLRFLELAFHKLRPGGRIVLETLNPACWVAFFESYIRDITHRWPLHPETLKYLVVASGFSRADVEFRSPVPPEDRLQPIAVPAGADAVLADVAEAFNANVEKLNARIFTYLDYAVVGEKPRQSR